MNDEMNRMIDKDKKEEAREAEGPDLPIKRYNELAIRETKLEKFLKYIEGYEFE